MTVADHSSAIAVGRVGRPQSPYVEREVFHSASLDLELITLFDGDQPSHYLLIAGVSLCSWRHMMRETHREKRIFTPESWAGQQDEAVRWSGAYVSRVHDVLNSMRETKCETPKHLGMCETPKHLGICKNFGQYRWKSNGSHMSPSGL